MKRRQFLAVSASSMFLAAGNSGFARGPIDRSGPPRFRTGLAAYSLRNYFSVSKGKQKTPAADGPAIDMFGFLDYCARQGFDAAEPTSYFFRADADEQYFRDLKHSAFVQGLAIAGTAIGNNFTVGKGPQLESEIDAAMEWIDRAAVLGAPHIRFFAGTRDQLAEHPDRLEEAVDAVSRCAAIAARHGIFLGVENHGKLSADQMIEIIDRVESRWVGINLDTGNFQSDDPYADLERCAPYAVNVQVKVNMKTPDGKRYPADLDRIGKILRDSGYQGFVVLEYEDEKPYENIPDAHQRLRKALQA